MISFHPGRRRQPSAARRFGRALPAALAVLAIAAPASADGAFPFKGMRIVNLTYTARDETVFDSANVDDDYQSGPAPIDADLNVFEGGRFLTWPVTGEFAQRCVVQGIDSSVAIVYGPSGAKSVPINCDGIEPGLSGVKRQILEGTYQSNTAVTGNVWEFTGMFSGHLRFYERASDTMPTFDDVGTVRQHAKIQIMPAGCKVLLYETESNVREEYTQINGDRRKVIDMQWVERMTPTTTCELTR